MVTFVCEVCNETLKKSAVINHSCRAGVTCVDCSKTFDRSSYGLHTSCVTEAEKYKHFGGSSGDRKEKKIKRDPQAEWTELIAKASSLHTSGRLMNILKQLTAYTNVPRKVKPFINFAKNSLKQHNETLLQDVYNAIQALLPPRPPQGVSLLVSEEGEVEKEVATKDNDEKVLVEEKDEEEEDSKPSRKRQRDGLEAVTSESKVDAVMDAEEKNVDKDEDLELEEGGLLAKKTRVTMKKLILTTLKLTEEKMKTKRLRKTCVEHAVKVSTAIDIDSAKGMFDAKLKMLINLGKVVESSDSKFVRVPLKDELYPSVE